MNLNLVSVEIEILFEKKNYFTHQKFGWIKAYKHFFKKFGYVVCIYDTEIQNDFIQEAACPAFIEMSLYYISVLVKYT